MKKVCGEKRDEGKEIRKVSEGVREKREGGRGDWNRTSAGTVAHPAPAGAPIHHFIRMCSRK